MDDRPSLHAVTWLVWAIAAGTTVQLAPSPVYVVVVIVLSALVVEVHGRDTALARAFPAFLLLGASFAVIRIVLTALTAHGAGRTLFTLPDATLPRMLGGFTVGGSVELEVVLQSAAEGLAIVGLVAAFGAFNAVVSHYELVQTAPRSFYEPGLVVTVALAVAPATVGAIRDVRLADRARTGGRPARRGRWLRNTLPVLETGMERAIHLSESMDSRGFARLAPTRADHVAAWCGLGALLALGGAFVALVGQQDLAAAGLAFAGTALLTAAVVGSSRSVRRSRYRARSFQPADWLVMAAAVMTPVVVAGFSMADEGSLSWSAYPLHIPDVNALVVLALLGLAVPLALRPAPTREHIS
ncbi:MAG: hypothetical protein R3A49_08605 [Acidimicrobiia bacterium]